MNKISVLLLSVLAVAYGCDSTAPAPTEGEKPPTSVVEKPVADEAKPDQVEEKAAPAVVDKGRSDLTPLELEREKILSELIAQMLGGQHIRQHKIDDEVSAEAFKLYMESLDPSRIFLLQSDVDKLQTHTMTMDDELKAGRLPLAGDGAAALQKGLKMARGFVELHMARPFDYTKAETLETDSEKRAWCKTEAELSDRWRKVLKLAVIRRIVRYEESAKARSEAAAKGEKPKEEEDILDKAPETDAEREKKAREGTAKDWEARFTRLEQGDHIDEIELFYNAIAGVFDPHTVFLPPARKENFDIQMSGSLEGIGAVLSEHENFISIVRIVPGSASWRQGDLEAGDLILSVAQKGKEAVDVVDMRLRDVVKLIRGPKGTVVTLTVKKPDEKVMVIPITRDVVKIEASYAKGAVLSSDKAGVKVGYIDLPSFYGNTRSKPGSTPERRCTDDVRKLLDIYQSQGIEEVIIDLRGNGGGLLSDARMMSGLFIEKGPIVQTKGVVGETEILADTDPSISFKGHVIVLVDRFSASASEILAGALQDYGRAVIVGSPQTHGKGTVQMLMNLDLMADPEKASKALRPLGHLKLTRQQFFRISGSSTQNRGIIPDVVLPDPASHIESGERYLDHAIPWSSVKGLAYKQWPTTYDKAKLNASSKARRSEHAGFKRAEDRAAYLGELREVTVEDLNLDAWRAQNKAERDKLDGLTIDIEKSPEILVVNPINYSGEPDPDDLEEDTDRRTGQPRKDVWKDKLARDYWVEEAIHLLKEMDGE